MHAGEPVGEFYIINERSHFPNHSCTYQDVMSAIKIQGESQARAVDRQSQTVETLVKTLQTERAKAAKRKLEKRVRKSKSQVIDAKELELKLLHQLSVQDPPLSVAPAATTTDVVVYRLSMVAASTDSSVS